MPDTTTSSASTFRESFETFSNGWIPLLATVYGFGYLVVSIYHASLGLNDINPFRVKIVAAGVLFIAINSLVIYEALYFQDSLRDFLSKSDASQWRNYWLCLTFGGLFLYWCDCLTSSLVFVIFISQGSQIHTRTFTTLVIIDGLVGAGIFASRQFEFIRRISKHALFILASGAFIVALLILSIPYNGQFGVRQLALYFLFVQISAIGIARDWHGSTRRGQNWGMKAIEILVPLLLFSLGVYPHIRAGFGGGQPISAQIDLSSPTTDSYARTMSVNIIDETDAGFYVAQKGRKIVQYIPRRFVDSIEFKSPGMRF